MIDQLGVLLSFLTYLYFINESHKKNEKNLFHFAETDKFQSTNVLLHKKCFLDFHFLTFLLNSFFNVLNNAKDLKI